jgi:type II secretory pathway predicted ATPase ExeA
MYESFFGLSDKPFSLLPDAGFLYLSRRHRRAINLLEYGMMTQAGFIVITGEVGAGKTTVIRRFLKTAASDITVGVITNPSPTLGHLMAWVARVFEIPADGRSDVELYESFVAFLVERYAEGKRTVLIIDEAQNLKTEMLEELRMLSNVNNEKDQLLQMVLVGQPELLDVLNKPELRQFVQRISVHCHLDPLAPAETAAYIRHRLHVVGAQADIFDDTACAAVHYFTGGVPRLINLLCDQALMYAFSEDNPHVDLGTVTDVVSDRNRSGLSAFKDLPDKPNAPTLPDILKPIIWEIHTAQEKEKT